MPVIQIKSLAIDPELEMDSLLGVISRSFAARTGIGLDHVSVTWEFFAPGHYTVGAVAPHRQPNGSHPILVDLLIPSFHEEERIESMLHTLAELISEHGGVAVDNIFINCRQAHSGMVLDSGAIARW